MGRVLRLSQGYKKPCGPDNSPIDNIGSVLRLVHKDKVFRVQTRPENGAASRETHGVIRLFLWRCVQ